MAWFPSRMYHVGVLELICWSYGTNALDMPMAKVLKLEAVIGLPKFGKIEKNVCGPCQLGKQTKSTHPKVNVVATSQLLELLHVDLMGPTRTESMGRKMYIMVVVDDFSRYSWVEFLREKSEACEKMEKLYKKLQNEKRVPIIKIRSDHGKEFENAKFEAFCNEHGIKKEFLAPKTPQQNGVVERKNCVIQEIARIVLLNKDILQKFWAKAVNTSYHIGNRIFFQVGTKKTSYEIRKEKKPKVKYFGFLEVNASFLMTRKILGSLMSRAMKEFSSGTP